MSDTPKTDALPQPYYNRADAIYEFSGNDFAAWGIHARDQERRIAELERDAARYQWIRAQKHAHIAACWIVPTEIEVGTTSQEVEAAIDAAMEKEKS